MKTHLLLTVALTTLLAAICLLPPSANAQTVGVILTHGAYDHERIHEALESSLTKSGHAANIKFLTQRPYADPIAFSNAARKLIAADVDVIISYGASPTFAVLREKPRIPILYAGIYEPVVSNIKSRYAAGVCTKLNISSLVRYLRASTSIKSMGVIYYSLENESKQQFQEINEMSGKYGFQVNPLDLKYKANLTEMLDTTKADAFIITSSLSAYTSLPTILRVAAANKIPTASLISSNDVAAMITLTADPNDQGERLAKMLEDLNAGKSPESLEQYCARKVELVYNVKEANRMGLKISMDLITEATRLINK